MSNKSSEALAREIADLDAQIRVLEQRTDNLLERRAQLAAEWQGRTEEAGS